MTCDANNEIRSSNHRRILIWWNKRKFILIIKLNYIFFSIDFSPYIWYIYNRRNIVFCSVLATSETSYFIWNVRYDWSMWARMFNQHSYAFEILNTFQWEIFFSAFRYKIHFFFLRSMHSEPLIFRKDFARIINSMRVSIVWPASASNMSLDLPATRNDMLELSIN